MRKTEPDERGTELMCCSALTWSKDRPGYFTPPNEVERLITLDRALTCAVQKALVPAFLDKTDNHHAYETLLKEVLMKYHFKGELRFLEMTVVALILVLCLDFLNEATFEAELYGLMKKGVVMDESLYLQMYQKGNDGHGNDGRSFRPDVVVYNQHRFAWIELKYVREKWINKGDHNLFKLCDRGKFKDFAGHAQDSVLLQRQNVGSDPKNSRLPNEGKVVFLVLFHDGRIKIRVQDGNKNNLFEECSFAFFWVRN